MPEVRGKALHENFQVHFMLVLIRNCIRGRIRFEKLTKQYTAKCIWKKTLIRTLVK